MVICGKHMLQFSVSKDIRKNNDNRRNLTCLLVNLLTLKFKELKINVEQGTIVTTLNIIKH